MKAIKHFFKNMTRGIKSADIEFWPVIGIGYVPVDEDTFGIILPFMAIEITLK